MNDFHDPSEAQRDAPEFFRGQVEATWGPGRLARIVGVHRREWDVRLAEGVVRAYLAGRRWDPKRADSDADVQPTVGDWVWVSQSDERRPVIQQVLRRRTVLMRASQARSGKRQAIVANIDRVAIVAALSPDGVQDAVARRSLNPRRIERYLAAIRQGGAQPLLLLNKSDLAETPAKHEQRLKKRLGEVSIMAVHCKDDGGISPLKNALRAGETVGFVGLSGVGKSSLINRLMGSDVQKTSAMREQDARGRHTTTHRELFETTEGFFVIDTPGMREFAPAEGNDEALEAFEDVLTFAADCRFRDCRHESEPGCAVQAALESGNLAHDRMRNYVALREEVAEKPRNRPRKVRTRPPHDD